MRQGDNVLVKLGKTCFLNFIVFHCPVYVERRVLLTWFPLLLDTCSHHYLYFYAFRGVKLGAHVTHSHSPPTLWPVGFIAHTCSLNVCLTLSMFTSGSLWGLRFKCQVIHFVFPVYSVPFGSDFSDL